MADDTADMPDTSNEGAKPAPRRRAARKTPTGATKASTAASSSTSGEAKPAATRRAPAKRASTAKAPTSATKTAKPVKPRSSKRATPPATRRPAKQKSTVERATDKVGGKWGAAAIAGGIAAAGAAATAALLSLRSSSRVPGTPKKPIDISGDKEFPQHHGLDVHGTAHQADGTDSSASFNAGIADEGTIPDKA